MNQIFFESYNFLYKSSSFDSIVFQNIYNENSSIDEYTHTSIENNIN